MTILEGKPVAELIKSEAKTLIDSAKLVDITGHLDNPKLLIIQFKGDDASEIYIRNKKRVCEELGIECNVKLIDTDDCDKAMSIARRAIMSASINRYNGVIVQAPIPKKYNIDFKQLVQAIPCNLDVDGLTYETQGAVMYDSADYKPCTPAGILRLLKYYNIDLAGKHVVVIGRSQIVGKPLANMLINEDATVTVCHSKTKDLANICKQADVLISAVGRPKFITMDMLKNDVVVIDVGMNRDESGHLCGDVDFNSVNNKIDAITPVPGGIGLTTTAMLAYNVAMSYNINAVLNSIDAR